MQIKDLSASVDSKAAHAIIKPAHRHLISIRDRGSLAHRDGAALIVVVLPGPDPAPVEHADLQRGSDEGEFRYEGQRDSKSWQEVERLARLRHRCREGDRLAGQSMYKLVGDLDNGVVSCGDAGIVLLMHGADPSAAGARVARGDVDGRTSDPSLCQIRHPVIKAHPAKPAPALGKCKLASLKAGVTAGVDVA